MKYLNQLDYKHVPYRTCVMREGYTDEQKIANVARCGCGLCSVCMMVEMLTTEELSIEECVRIAEECVANHANGTDMKIFAPIIAEKYGLEYTPSGDVNEAVAHLQSGGQIVVHVGVPDGEKTGLFTVGGHYMLLTATDGKEFCILDPSYTPEKYLIPERVGKVNVSHAPYLYCDIHTLHAQRRVGRKYVYHMFKRKR